MLRFILSICRLIVLLFWSLNSRNKTTVDFGCVHSLIGIQTCKHGCLWFQWPHNMPTSELALIV